LSKHPFIIYAILTFTSDANFRVDRSM